MASTIKLKNGSGAPTSGQLVQGEPALDLTNKRLYTENASGTVIEVGVNPTSITTGNLTANGTINLTGATVSNAGSITTADINGGTIDGTVIGGSSAAAGSFTTISASGEIAANGGVAFGDNDKATFGASDDLQIYHDGTNSYIDDAGTGNLRVRANSLELTNADYTQSYLQAVAAGSVSLFHAGNAKLATTATGIDVTGTVTADGLSILSNTTGNAAFLYNSDSSANGTVLKLRSGNVGGTTDVLSIFDGNNNEQARFTASGRLGIGTSSPARELQVEGNAHFGTASAGVTLGENSGVASVYGLNASGTTYKPVEIRTGSSGSGFYQNTSGNVGIGTTSPTEKLTLNASADYKLSLKHPSDGSYAALGAINNNFLLYNNGSERMRIDSSGNLLIGTSTAGASKLVVNDDSIQVNTAKTPASASDTGTTGEIAWDANYVYVCVATNTWKRSALSTW